MEAHEIGFNGLRFLQAAAAKDSGWIIGPRGTLDRLAKGGFAQKRGAKYFITEQGREAVTEWEAFTAAFSASPVDLDWATWKAAQA